MCVIPPSSDIRGDGADGSLVLALFVLVRSALFRDGIFSTTGSEEQILASMVPGAHVRR